MEALRLAESVDQYVHLVGLLEDDEYYDISIPVILADRDAIAEGWSGLDAEQRARVEAADKVLAQKHRIVAQMLPHPEHTDRHAWWWHLNEGPQVREEAEKKKVA